MRNRLLIMTLILTSFTAQAHYGKVPRHAAINAFTSSQTRTLEEDKTTVRRVPKNDQVKNDQVKNKQ